MSNWINSYVGEKIRIHRKQKGKTQEQLSVAMDLSRTSIANFETAYQAISIVKLYEIAIFLGKKINDFLPQTEIVKKDKKRLRNIVHNILSKSKNKRRKK